MNCQADVKGRNTAVWFAVTVVTVALALLCVFTGSVDIPFDETWRVLTGGEASKQSWNLIVTELRVPATVTAALTGAALGVAGLLLQTVFNNPLAGPSIMGVSTGASLGVAILVLAAPGFFDLTTSAIVGATVGAVAVIAVLLLFSAVVRSAMMLLIVGIMLSYLTSSAISLLNFYATQEGVHSFVIWGLGNFSAVGSDNLALFSSITGILLFASLFIVKPLNALLLGERYAANIGTDVKTSRNITLLLSGGLVAVTTAFCGPIGFLGLAVPHIARLVFRTSNHRCLIPGVMVVGALTGLLTLWISMLPGDRGTLPVNAITPLIGVPVVIYIIVNRRKLSYFN